MRVDARAILRPPVPLLPVQSSRIVPLVEEVHQLLIADLLRVECHLHCLSVARSAGANLHEHQGL